MKFYQTAIIALLLNTCEATTLKQLNALGEKPKEPVPPPKPTQAGWNTAANAIKKPGNETKCNPAKCGSYSVTSDRACCHAGDDVAKPSQMPAYPFPVPPKKEEKKALVQKEPKKEEKKSPYASPPGPTQQGWNTQANAIKKPSNATGCNPAKCGSYSVTSDRACCHGGDVVSKSNVMPAYPFVEEKKEEGALSQINKDEKKDDEMVPPPKPTQAGWNTAANAIKKPGNATKCNPAKCGSYSVTSDRACCHEGDDVPKGSELPKYPFPVPKKEKKKA